MSPATRAVVVLLAFVSGPVAVALFLWLSGASAFAPLAGPILLFTVPGLLLLAVEGRKILTPYLAAVLLIPAGVAALLSLPALEEGSGSEPLAAAALGFVLVGLPAALPVLVLAGLAKIAPRLPPRPR